jgi:hypothetical protein
MSETVWILFALYVAGSAVYLPVAWRRGWAQPVFREIWAMRHPVRYARQFASDVRAEYRDYLRRRACWREYH